MSPPLKYNTAAEPKCHATSKPKCHSILEQICNLIPPHLVAKLARKHGVHKQARAISPWSHIVAMIYAQLARSFSLNDVADALRNHKGALARIRRATPPSRNGLSHATKIRSADMAEDLFWSVLAEMKKQSPSFGVGHRYSGLPRRFKRAIYAIDSTTIQLVANCISWAKHRRRKAAAKCHMNLELQHFLPSFAIVKAANTHDSTEAHELCGHLQDGEIALFDRAYLDFAHLFHLNQRGVFWVTRIKSNSAIRVVGQHTPPKGNILGDYEIELKTAKSANQYPRSLRLVVAEVEINGELKRMAFLTNNFTWAAGSVCDLYQSRWGIEVFFKQIKQTLQLSSFLGHSEQAIRWQVWMALLTYILLRYVGHLSSWRGSFRRLFTLIRGVLLSRRDLWRVLSSCGTAVGRSPPVVSGLQPCVSDSQLYLPGFE